MTHTDTGSHGVVDAYLERIGYHAGRDATLETLAAIHQLHTAAIAFENLNPLLGEPVRLDIDALVYKLLKSGRGGYCFEHNLLLGYVLRRLGFGVTNLAARVRWGAPDSAITPRSHMLLRVEVAAQPFIVDAGFGGATLTGPLRLVTGIEQPTPHETFRLLEDPHGVLMQAHIDGDWKALYSFDLQPQYQVDYEVSNWYVSTHPASHFRTGLSAARPDRGVRYALRNTQLAIHHTGGATERRALSSTRELRAVLEDVFRIRLPDTAALEPALQTLVAEAGAAGGAA